MIDGYVSSDAKKPRAEAVWRRLSAVEGGKRLSKGLSGHLLRLRSISKQHKTEAVDLGSVLLVYVVERKRLRHTPAQTVGIGSAGTGQLQMKDIHLKYNAAADKI
jgi:hypothetical protein